MSSSQSVRSEGEMVPKLRPRPLMSVRLFHAAINGTMSMPPVAGEHQQDGVRIDMGQNQTEQAEGRYPTEQAELPSVTRSMDTLLHLLVTNGHNSLAFRVFESDMLLLGAQNMMLETPLHCAAKVENNEFISSLITNHPITVKEVLRMRSKEGDTAMHVAAKHGCKYIGQKMMECDGEVAYDVNNEKLSPLSIAIIKENLGMVKIMIRDDPTLASTQFSNGMFPVHLAASMGQTEMVMHFIAYYPDAAKLLDRCGRNLLHIATEEDQNLAAEVDRKLAAEEDRNFAADVHRKLGEMKHEMDYEKNSMLHVAAMKGHLSLMKDIWEKYNGQGDEENTHGLTPIDLFLRQRATTKVDDSFARTTDEKKLSDKWFKDAMALQSENQWKRTHDVIGLGSVLITTVTFATAITFPGGYDQTHGTPLLGRSYMFRAFIISNTFAFIYGFLSLCIFLTRPRLAHRFAIDAFLLAACTMLVTFELGLYVTLHSICLPLAIIVLVITSIICIVNNINVRKDNRTIGLFLYAVTFLAIFGLAKV